MQSVALYLRSSKDRSDVSIDAQRRKLTELASQRSLAIAAEFVDAVESGKDDDRPGFQQLLRELKSRTRAWTAVLLLDTSRLSRNIYLAECFKHECRKRGVRIVYANLPESNPIMDMMMVQILQAWDQMHSMMSREKGLAGMAENVRQGFRAGGRAPWGYRLVGVETGAMRDGQAVMKSRLEPTDEGVVAGRYLEGRAAGKGRSALARALGIEREQTSLIGTEWNALTYAGHTVWNTHNARTGDGYQKGEKRRPRAEWIVQRDTHMALITDDQAEAILARLENSTQGKRRQRVSDYLLTGLLVTPAGTAWHGDAGTYRSGNRRVVAAQIERAVLDQVAGDWSTPAFADTLLASARQAQSNVDDTSELDGLKRRRSELDRSVARITQLLDQTTAVETLLRKLEMLEAEQKHTDTAIADAIARRDQMRAMQEITHDDVAAMLQSMSETMEGLERPLLKELLAQQLRSIELDLDASRVTIHYAFPVETGVTLASPRGFEPRYLP